MGWGGVLINILTRSAEWRGHPGSPPMQKGKLGSGKIPFVMADVGDEWVESLARSPPPPRRVPACQVLEVLTGEIRLYIIRKVWIKYHQPLYVHLASAEYLGSHVQTCCWSPGATVTFLWPPQPVCVYLLRSVAAM